MAGMKRNKLPSPSLAFMLSGALLLAASCAMPAGNKDDASSSFARVKPVLERNCVHCHASIRLPGMPSLNDTNALAGLIGPNKLIVPGKPEQSRFYEVVTLSDEQPGAMPPTGHAITPKEVATLRQWIQDGARLPAENIMMQPVGISPRSR
jgi:mono/diheme cytochrome c family protein